MEVPMAKDKEFEKKYLQVKLDRARFRRSEGTRSKQHKQNVRERGMKCDYCDGYMSWCSCCDCWTRTCCEEWGSCACS